tara:strand:+ start:143 stop:571 length:429 start_codon:yes stop_codon:yes gene_type:complete
MIDDVLITREKRILHPQGDILHALKRTSPGFLRFGEAYFSIVNPGVTKGWKRHRRATLNLVVPVGEVRFVVYDDRPLTTTRGQFMEITLAETDYKRLTVPPMLWVAFQGVNDSLNLILNIADEEHEANEYDKAELSTFSYSW